MPARSSLVSTATLGRPAQTNTTSPVPRPATRPIPSPKDHPHHPVHTHSDGPGGRSSRRPSNDEPAPCSEAIDDADDEKKSSPAGSRLAPLVHPTAPSVHVARPATVDPVPGPAAVANKNGASSADGVFPEPAPRPAALRPPSSSLDTRPPSVLGLLALPADYFSPLFPAATDAAAVVPALPSPSIRRRGRSGTLTLACKVPLPLGSESSDDSDSDSSSSDEECLIEDDSLPRHNHNRHHNHSHRHHHSYNHHASGTVSPSFSDASDKSEDSAGPLTPPTLVGAIALPQQSPPPSPSTNHPTCSSQPVATLSPTSPASPSSPYPARSRVRGGVVVRFGEAPGIRLPVTPPLELNLLATAARPSTYPASWSPTSLSSPSGPPPLSTTTILLDEDDDDDDDEEEEEEDVVSDDDDSSSDEDNYDAVDTGRVASPPLSPTTLLASKPQPNDTFQSAASRATPLTRCASTSSPPAAAVLPVDDAFLDNVDIYALSSASSSSCTNFNSADDEPDSDDEDDPYSVLAPAAAPGGGATWLAPDGTWRVDWLALGEYLRMVEKRLRPIVDPVRRSPLSFSWIPEEEEEKQRERAREWVSAVEEEETDEWLAMDDFVLEWEDE